MTRRGGAAAWFVAQVLVTGVWHASPLPAQQQDPRPAEAPSAPGSPVRAGQPVTSGARQPTRLAEPHDSATASRPFETWTIELPYRRGVTIWARNLSADTVIITLITLSDCQNLSAACGPATLNLVLGQRDSAQVVTLRPRIWDQPYAYRVSWEWSFPADVHATESGPDDGPGLPFAVWAQTFEERHEVAVMARNTSPDTVIVSRVHLSDCNNIGIKCGTVGLNLRLAPGDSVSTIILRPDRWGEPLDFHFEWEWNWVTGDR